MYKIEQAKTLDELESQVSRLLIGKYFKCSGGIFYDSKTDMYYQVLERR